jgi:hypothetical protein
MIYRPNSASNGGAEALLWPGKSIPLSPDKALLIAQKWCLLHGFADPDLVFMDIDPIWSLRRMRDGSRRFYYCIHLQCPRRTGSMPVIVLFNGSIVESVEL